MTATKPEAGKDSARASLSHQGLLAAETAHASHAQHVSHAHTTFLTIGAVSDACGIPVETLRTWERRYGFPVPRRTSGNQRLYGADAVEQLLAIKQAMAGGLQASRAVQLVRASDAAAQRQASARPDEADTAESLPVELHPNSAWLDRWLYGVATLDGDGLEQTFRRDHGLLGTMRFLTERAGPFLDAVGHAWAAGRISVANEHFASERLRDFLTNLWTPIAAENRGPSVVCMTMPGEMHHLGLHMAATVVALAGLRVVFLGANLPPQDAAQAVQMSGAAAVLVSISRVVEPPTVRRQLYELRLALGDGTAIVMGGKGAPAGYDSFVAPEGLDGLLGWAADLFSSRH